jgi:hypothetical protein
MSAKIREKWPFFGPSRNARPGQDFEAGLSPPHAILRPILDIPARPAIVPVHCGLSRRNQKPHLPLSISRAVVYELEVLASR